MTGITEYLSIQHARIPGKFELVWTRMTPDGTESYSVRLVRLSDEMAAAIRGPHTGITRSAQFPEVQDVAPRGIRIEKIPDRAPGTRAWGLRIGDEPVTVGTVGLEKDPLALSLGQTDPDLRLRIDDDAVKILDRLARVSFEPGEPDWMRRNLEIAMDQAHQAHLNAQRADEKVRRLREMIEARPPADDIETPAP